MFFEKLLLPVLLLFSLCGSGQQVNSDQPLNSQQIKSTEFGVSAGGSQIFTEQFKDVNYTMIEFNKSVPLKVAFNGEIHDFEISPKQLNIKGVKQENNILFDLNKTGYLVVTVNKTHRLFIFIIPGKKIGSDSIEKTMVNIRSYGLDGKGLSVETQKLQKALDDISVSGKTLLFPPGVYKTGTLKIKSNSHLYLAAGAMIKGSENRIDYPVDEGFKESDIVNDKANYTDNGERMTFSRLILIDNAENVVIKGRGVIDGSGSVVRPQGKPANLIRIRNSKNIFIEGVILRDPAAWNTHILNSENVTIRNVKIINDRTIANTDGIDPDGSRNILIDHCFAYCSDDNIAIKASNNGGLLKDIDSITVKNCIFLTKKSSLKVGTETKAAIMKNITFENNDVIESDRGMALYCPDGALFQNIRFINNRFEDNYPDAKQCGIHFTINKRNADSNIGQMKEILIKDCVFYKAFPKVSAIVGFDEGHRIQMTVENLVISGKKCTTVSDAHVDPNGFTDVTIK